MKLIIDIDEELYKAYKGRSPMLGDSGVDIILRAVTTGKPYEEKSQSEFTDLEQKVIADAINYLLGAELLEENGYTEEVIEALKSVLQKLGAEEDY